MSRRGLASAALRSPFGVSVERDFAAAAPPARFAASRLAAGVAVASLETGALVSNVAVVVRAGSRAEDAALPQGTAHVAKAAFFRNTPTSSAFKSVRDSELAGASLYSALTREHHVFGSEFLRESLNDQLSIVVNHAFNTLTNAYEFEDITARAAGESAAAQADPASVVDEALHAAAFRDRGLGLPLYAAPEAVGEIRRKHVAAFVATNFAAGRIAIVGTGVDHDELVAAAEGALAKHALPGGNASSSSPPPAAKYFGGETRIAASADSSQLVVAFPVEGGLGGKHAAAAMVVEGILDGHKRAHWGTPTGTSAPLSKASTADTHATSFCRMYSDAGLVGIRVAGDAGEVAAVATKAVAALKAVAAAADDAKELARGKNVAIIEHEGGASAEATFDRLVHQAFSSASSGITTSDAQLKDAIAKVSASDVKSLVKAMLAAKPSVVAYGDTRKLPYLDELKL